MEYDKLKIQMAIVLWDNHKTIEVDVGGNTCIHCGNSTHFQPHKVDCIIPDVKEYLITIGV